MVQKIRKEKVLTMEPLKVGDWVISTSWVNAEPNKITKIELATCQDEEDFVFFRENWCVELKYIQKWIPEPGEWCWFWDNETDVPTLAKLISINKLFEKKETYTVATPSCISELSYNYSRTMTFKYCEPFVRELPDCLQI